MMFHRLDVDGNGTISKEELLGAYTGDARKFFGALDVNGDDAVSMEEWEALFAKMQQGLGVEKVRGFVMQLETSENEQTRERLTQSKGALGVAEAAVTETQQGKAEALKNQLAMASAQGGEEMEQAKAAMAEQAEAK